MRVTEVKYMRRYNLGNYEHEEIMLGAALEDGEDHLAALNDLKTDVEAAKAGATSTGSETPAE